MSATITTPRRRLAAEDEVGAEVALGHGEVVSAFSEVAHAITRNADLDTLLHLVAERICALLGICRCSVYLRDPGSDVFRGQVAHSNPNIDLAIKRYTAGIEADGFTREILSKKRPVLIVNAQSDPRPIRSAMLAFSISRMLGVPMVLRGEVIGLLFLDNEDEHHEYTPEQQELSFTFASLAAIAISQAQLTKELRSTLSTAAQQNAILRRAAALEDRLTDLVVDGADLGVIAGVVTDLTGKPCEICDSNLRRLACASPDALGSLPPLLEPAVAREAVVREALDALTPRRPTVLSPVPAVGLHRRRLVAAVQVGSDLWGYLVLLEHGSRFGAQDAIVAKRAATIIALELRGRQRTGEAELDALEAIARDLLRGDEGRASLMQRGADHGLALDRPHLVVVLSGRGSDSSGNLTRRRVSKALGHAESALRAFAARLDQGIAIIFESDESTPACEATEEAKRVVERVLEQVAPDGRLIGSISTMCHDIRELPDALEQARQVGRWAARSDLSDARRVVAADDLGPGRLLLSLADRADAHRFVRDTLGPLLDSSPGADDLLETLQAFFASARNVRRAAESLGVHDNTIRYRLGRIADLTGIDVVADSKMQLAAELSLLVLRLEGREPCRDGPTRRVPTVAEATLDRL